jgi:hypothetical protein
MSDAADLASLFFQWSLAVDAYRDKNTGTLTPDEKIRLKDLSNQLDDISTHFTLQDIGSIITSIQAQIGQIKTVTAQAKKTLKNLTTAATVIKVVSAVAAIGVSAASGNIGGIVGAIGDLTKEVSSQDSAPTKSKVAGSR